MPVKKATSAAPAASRTRAPRTAAVKGTQTPESRGPSRSIVREPANLFHHKVMCPNLTPQLVFLACAYMAERSDDAQDAATLLVDTLELSDHYGLEHSTTLQCLKEAEDDEDRTFYIRLHAARMFQAAFQIGFHVGRTSASVLAAESKAGAR